MTDGLRSLGRNLRRTKQDAEDAIRRVHPRPEILEHARDTFDLEVPFEMEFEIPSNSSGTIYLNLIFIPPLKEQCCELYTPANAGIITTTYPFTSVWAFGVWGEQFWNSEFTKGFYEIPLLEGPNDSYDYQIIDNQNIRMWYDADPFFTAWRVCYVYVYPAPEPT